MSVEYTDCPQCGEEEAILDMDGIEESIHCPNCGYQENRYYVGGDKANAAEAIKIATDIFQNQILTLIDKTIRMVPDGEEYSVNDVILMCLGGHDVAVSINIEL